MAGIVLVRGGGDLASGVALRLHRVGIHVVITELPEPLVVRRMVAFAQAVYAGRADVEEVTARRIDEPHQAEEIFGAGEIPVLVDPQAVSRNVFTPTVLVDGRMTKFAPELEKDAAPLVIGLGPGFQAGQDCHVVIETQRGHFLGRAIWQGAAEPDTGIPDSVSSWHGAHSTGEELKAGRVLRAPTDGVLLARAEIGDHLESGQPVAEVGGEVIEAPFAGVLRGLLYPGVQVRQGIKIGDIDPRDDPRYCTMVSDKSLAVGGGALEAILSRPDIRRSLWDGL